MSLSYYTVKYKVAGNRGTHSLEVGTVGQLTQKSAKRLVAQAQSLPQNAVSIVSVTIAKGKK